MAEVMGGFSVLPRANTPLSVKAVEALKHSGAGAKSLHQVESVPGLYLSVYATGSHSWLLRVTVNKTRKEFGLGSYKSLSLAKARVKAAEWRRSISGTRYDGRLGRFPVW